MRSFFHPLSEWELIESGGYRVYRKYREFGPAELYVGGGCFLVFERRGIKEWDGHVLRRWVEVRRVGFKMGAHHPVLWYA
jgi:hypothetical protein